MVTPYSKNRRVVTIINTDVEGGTKIGMVAFVEVVAMMIGRIEQCYSDNGYEEPVGVEPGLFMKKGRPKSLYRPGSSTDIVLFQKGRVEFSEDLARNSRYGHPENRFSSGFGVSLVETAVACRSTIAKRREG
jgi:phosphatidylserine decarboxylase